MSEGLSPTQALATDFARRRFLRSSAVIVSFSAFPASLLALEATAGAQTMQGDLGPHQFLDAWIGIDGDGKVTVFSGKAELGQGIRTAFTQIAAEQLGVGLAAITMVMASTARTPNETYTAGSNSMSDSGNAIAHAAAQLRGIVLEWAAEHLRAPANALKVDNGLVLGPSGKTVTYGELVSGRSLHVPATRTAMLVGSAGYKVIGRSVARLDIPPKLTGQPSFIHDMRPKGMLHARVVRPTNHAAELVSAEIGEVAKMPGVVRVVQQGSFLAVVARGEFQCIQAMRALQATAVWKTGDAFEPYTGATKLLRAQPSDDLILEERGTGSVRDSANVIVADFSRPYVMHASIGPSCAIAQFKDGRMSVWTHSQGVFALRSALAKVLGLAEDEVDCIHAEGAGCYGHNGADDAAGDAAVIALAVPDTPIRVQWMREDEHGWEPYGSPMTTQLRATMSADGRITGWDCDVWSLTFTTRPGGKAANVLAAWHLPAKLGPPQGFNLKFPTGGGTNAVPYYDIPATFIAYHYVPAPLPPRTSALRSLGGYFNVFAAESFMDELAQRAQQDPVAFRLKHLSDPRGRDVLQKAAKEFGWDAAATLPRYRGRGIGYVHFETDKTYCAVAVEVAVNPESGQIKVVRAVAAVDCGTAVNPDGIRNQIQGCIMQSTSWTLHEAVSFDEKQILSRDWNSYPILRFDETPDSVDVHVINRPDEAFLGTGEAGMGPVPAAIANALRHATGVRMRDLPFTAEAVRKAMLEVGPPASTIAGPGVADRRPSPTGGLSPFERNT